MTKFIGVLSGKGGVGKTTIAINLGVALTGFGKDTILVDANLTTPHVGLYLGVSSVPRTFHDSFSGHKITDAIYRHASGLKIIPGDISIQALRKIDIKKLKKIFGDLRGSCEIALVDMGAGLNNDVSSLIQFMDEVIIVVSPDMLSVTDALKTLKLAEEKNATVLGVVVNKNSFDSELSVDNVEAILGVPVITSVDESVMIKKSLTIKYPVVYTDPNSSASSEIKRLAARLIGQEYEGNIKELIIPWYKRLFNIFK